MNNCYDLTAGHAVLTVTKRRHREPSLLRLTHRADGNFIVGQVSPDVGDALDLVQLQLHRFLGFDTGPVQGIGEC